MKTDGEKDGHSIFKLVILCALALGSGFLLFNFQHIVHVSHFHLSLHTSHRATAFCAFAGCKSEDMPADASGVIPEASRNASAEANSSKVSVSTLAAVDPPVTDAVVKALRSRVCGSPAIDGYSHVVPKCLEDSPTAKWWAAYYKAGGRQRDLVVHIEKNAEFDGLAVAWGLGNKKATAEECAAQCLAHMPGQIDGPFKNLPCNAFSWCPDDVCFAPDAHHHTKGDCWIKFTEGPAWPEINMRGVLPPEFKTRHPEAPDKAQWWGGVLLPQGVLPTNGTFGPRWKW
ncbi:hypothetical protein FOA52_003441 [Chlamydomonas sp. UWO 241]|nr:hypothetical protein FOA52_003441 [Chlamydomonas sp. UWO 241]